jgi:hypothetical protein
MIFIRGSLRVGRVLEMGLGGKSLLDPPMVCRIGGTAQGKKTKREKAEGENAKDLTQRTERRHRDHGDMANEIQARLRAILL